MDLVLTPKSVAEEKFGAIKVSKVEPTPPEEIEKRRQEIYLEMYHSQGVRMLTETDHSYRENSGMEALDISVKDMSWNELLGTLAAKPKRFYKVPTDGFIGTDSSGNERTPAIATIQKAIDREAFKRGLVLGYASVGSGKFEQREREVKDANGVVVKTETYEYEIPVTNSFELCARTNVTKVPKRVWNAIDGHLSQEDFGTVPLVNVE